MGTITAQILIGSGHPNDGGIDPVFEMKLVEGSQAVWILQQVGRQARLIRWTPTGDRMLEDALLMVALFVEKDAGLLHAFHQKTGKTVAEPFVFYETFDSQARNLLYEQCKTIPFKHKLIVNAFAGSSILWQLQKLQSYQLEVEATVPLYTRLHTMFGGWSNWRTHGTFDHGNML